MSENQIVEAVPYWHSRGYLPHCEEVERAQIITYRLHDSLPKAALIKLAAEIEHVAPNRREIERRRRIEEYLDRGAGSCSLSNKLIGEVIEQNLLHFDGKRYNLHAWIIMPNHVHILLTPGKDATLSGIVHSWKSYTAKRANAILGRQTEFWQREYFDRTIRNQSHFIDAISYIHNNPVKASLCNLAAEWQFSSARLV